ncbi:MAG: pilus assembly protein TadG-related protein [Anaerolineales bacterium]
MSAPKKLDLRGLQHGQAMVLIALAFVGLAAFIGLAVDAGILFSNLGHLRRATDAASLAAANQFREGRTPPELSAMANELLIINGLSPSGVVAKICDLSNLPGPPIYTAYHDPALCPGGVYPPAPGEPFTKEVRVEATLPVNFAFLPIIGWNSLSISADSVSQAASVDLVLIIDNSGSMAFDLCTNGINDDDPDDAIADDCNGFSTPQVGATSDADAALCNAAGTCEPFESIRVAALGLLGNMFFPYDRMAVVSYSHLSATEISLTAGNNFTAVQTAINNLVVSGPAPNPPCDISGGDPRGCPTTNTAAGLTRAGSLLGDNDGDPLVDSDGDGNPALDFRADAVWIVILLSDGAANTALAEGGNPTIRDDWICPPPGGPPGGPTWVPGFCRDPVFEVGTGAYGLDAEDAAVNAGLFVGCPDSTFPQPAGCSAASPGGQGAVIFTIGYGDLVINSPACRPFYDVQVPPIPCEPNQGEELLRFIADIGDDNDPGTRACAGKPTSSSGSPENCGNYFFAADSSQLEKVFEAIASRIFTRITH